MKLHIESLEAKIVNNDNLKEKSNALELVQKENEDLKRKLEIKVKEINNLRMKTKEHSLKQPKKKARVMSGHNKYSMLSPFLEEKKLGIARKRMTGVPPTAIGNIQKKINSKSNIDSTPLFGYKSGSKTHRAKKKRQKSGDFLDRQDGTTPELSKMKSSSKIQAKADPLKSLSYFNKIS